MGRVQAQTGGTIAEGCTTMGSTFLPRARFLLPSIRLQWPPPQSRVKRLLETRKQGAVFTNCSPNRPIVVQRALKETTRVVLLLRLKERCAEPSRVKSQSAYSRLTYGAYFRLTSGAFHRQITFFTSSIIYTRGCNSTRLRWQLENGQLCKVSQSNRVLLSRL